ncbi:peptidylprolyl isomerase [Desulfobacterium sp. N47]|uniref:PpiC domain-containing protein n=1 Tax=uncultured Desulfobacterium sp. TaxID=201089 RepID=E1YBR0_9BACT|nr:hypothetical protein N47_G33280 [uncultured Desulfobacterium sp.]
MKSKFTTYLNNIVMIFILLILQAGFIYDKPCGAEVVDRVVAVVNDDVITLSDLEVATRAYTEKIKSAGYGFEEEHAMLFKMREDMLDQLINRKLTDQEIKKYGISTNDKEIDNSIERIKEAKYLTDEELRNMVTKDGMTFDDFRDAIKENILRSKVLDIEVKSKIVITKEDTKAYYDSHKSDYMPQNKYHLFNIIIKTNSEADGDDKHEAMSVMEKIYAKLKQGQPFEEVSKDSAESSGVENSDLGYFKADELSPQIQDAIKNLKQKEFTKILETDLGYQIIYIKDIEVKPGKSLDEAAAGIQGILFNDIIDKNFKLWMEQLRKKSYIKIIK